MRNPVFLHMQKQRLRSAVLTAFVFTTEIVPSLNILNPKFPASSHILWLYGPVCIRPGQEPRKQVLSWPSSIYM